MTQLQLTHKRREHSIIALQSSFHPPLLTTGMFFQVTTTVRSLSCQWYWLQNDCTPNSCTPFTEVKQPQGNPFIYVRPLIGAGPMSLHFFPSCGRTTPLHLAVSLINHGLQLKAYGGHRSGWSNNGSSDQFTPVGWVKGRNPTQLYSGIIP